jgi:prephenate dehydrogenase
MSILIIDGQGGKMGAMLVKKLKERSPLHEIIAIGTNSAATSAMLKAGADMGATGENPVVRASMTAEVIAGPIGIIAAHSILGEVTPAMAEAVSGSAAKKVLVPVQSCNIKVAGVRELKLSEYIDSAVEEILK